MGVRTPQELKRYTSVPRTRSIQGLSLPNDTMRLETSFASVLTTKSMGHKIGFGALPHTAFAIDGVWRSQRSPELLKFQTIGKLKTPQAAEIPQTGFAALASTLLRV